MTLENKGFSELRDQRVLLNWRGEGKEYELKTD
jgi:hypothetical protein